MNEPAYFFYCISLAPKLKCNGLNKKYSVWIWVKLLQHKMNANRRNNSHYLFLLDRTGISVLLCAYGHGNLKQATKVNKCAVYMPRQQQNVDSLLDGKTKGFHLQTEQDILHNFLNLNTKSPVNHPHEYSCTLLIFLNIQSHPCREIQ